MILRRGVPLTRARGRGVASIPTIRSLSGPLTHPRPPIGAVQPEQENGRVRFANRSQYTHNGNNSGTPTTTPITTTTTTTILLSGTRACDPQHVRISCSPQCALTCCWHSALKC
jgi:hypothetical protein